MQYEAHRKSYSRLYRVRSAILTKCYNKNAITYDSFGGKGIEVCQEWRESFLTFEKWALDNGYKSGLSIKRIDCLKDFSPNNCIIANSCGNKKTHGMSKTRPYRIRQSMIARCHNENFNDFDRYGAKGIAVCNEWRESFENFWEWASSNGYSDDLTIDRINPNGNYEPSNCRWATQHEQILNQERNKNRTKEDKYIRKLDDGRYFLAIQKRENGIGKLLFSKVCDSKKDAIMERDFFLENGKRIVHHKLFKTSKQKSLIPQNRIGHKILMILLDQNMTIVDLARKLGVSRQAAHQWIYKKREPRKAAYKVAELFNMPVSKLVA